VLSEINEHDGLTLRIVSFDCPHNIGTEPDQSGFVQRDITPVRYVPLIGVEANLQHAPALRAVFQVNTL
jgi:hypothetical protein